jgi:hypothetical protein
MALDASAQDQPVARGASILQWTVADDPGGVDTLPLWWLASMVPMPVLQTARRQALQWRIILRLPAML